MSCHSIPNVVINVILWGLPGSRQYGFTYEVKFVGSPRFSAFCGILWSHLCFVVCHGLYVHVWLTGSPNPHTVMGNIINRQWKCRWTGAWATGHGAAYLLILDRATAVAKCLAGRNKGAAWGTDKRAGALGVPCYNVLWAPGVSPESATWQQANNA